MFLSLVRPDRISSPITRSPAVTASWREGASGRLMRSSMSAAGAAARRPRLYSPTRPDPAKAETAGEKRLPAGPFGPRMGRMDSMLEAPPSPAKAPLRPISYARPDIAWEQAEGGVFRLRSRTPLASYEPSLARLF